MSFFSDLFGGADAAAASQTAAIGQGLSTVSANTQAANQGIATGTAQALVPQQQNLATAQQGVGALGNALGLNGPAGTQSAMTALETTPGFQAELGAGNAAVNAGAAASGNLNSGNQLLALQKTGENTAATNDNNYISQLQPYLGAASSAASGIGNLYENQINQSTGLTTNLNNLTMGADTGIGNAQASAALSNQSLGLGLLGGGLTALTGGLGGGLGSSLMGGLGSLGAAATGGGVGTFTGGFGAAPSFSLFSDERLKEDIEPVGELYDGTNVYRYRYIGDDTPRIGVMAQEIAEDRPEAVTDVGGWLAVDYGKATERAAELARLLDAA